MTGRSRLSKSGELTAVLLITLLAAFLRFYRLQEIPPGLHFDEGFKGVTARALLTGAPPQLFFESDMGEEPIAIYLVAAALGLAGQEPWIIRLPSALVGTLTVPLAWWLGRELFRAYPLHHSRRRRVHPSSKPTDHSHLAQQAGRTGMQEQILGLVTALVLAILYWHLSFSRIGMEPILVPFFATLALAALLRGLNSNRWAWFALAGLALGGSLYTYKAGYFFPLVAALFIAFTTLMDHGFLARYWQGLLLTVFLAVLVAAPIVIYFGTHPANFLQRPASVALVGSGREPSSPWPGPVKNLPSVLGMFFLRGDPNPRSNLPGRPALDPFLAFLFIVGLGRALVDTLRGRAMAALILIWVGIMILPTLITEDAPHFGRAIGATPALALLCALGAWSLWQGAVRVERQWLKAMVVLLLAAGLVLSGLSTARAYYLTWGQSPDLFYAYDVGLTEVAGYVNTLPAEQDVYLTPTSRKHFSLAYLVRRPFGSFDGRAGLVFAPPDRDAMVVVLLREDSDTLPALQQMRPDGSVAWTLTDGFGRPYAAAYHLPALAGEPEPFPLPDHPLEAIIGGAVRLLGYSVEPEAVAPGDSLNLILYWQALAPLDDDYTVFAHLLGGYNPSTSGPLWAGHDAQPDQGHYPTTAWRAGEVILDVHPLVVPADAPPGQYQLEAGLYLLSTMARLPATDATGQPLADDAVILGTIQVED